ncbi:hypothetical protein [uncultured Aquabacterium sp.]|uniref:hypothetical protein n=1 Tax=uncultured Aquabacterium sp. TaxID=158753 RepID=UPI0025F6E1D2|nr:hypothetical protein [uncultured Aquabacterium sp.]
MIEVANRIRKLAARTALEGFADDLRELADYVEQQASPATVQQPAPLASDGPATWDLVVKDMQARDKLGRARYGTPLQPNNGRKSLVDAYQEVLDLAAYMRNAIEEQDADKATVIEGMLHYRELAKDLQQRLDAALSRVAELERALTGAAHHPEARAA